MTQFFRRPLSFSSICRGGVVAIGNFDGVHTGHQALLQSVTDAAKACGGPSIVLTFEPQPREFFNPETAGPRVTDWRQKFTLLAAAGVDVVIMLPFDERVAALSADAFMKQILKEGLGVKRIITGLDFRFGQGRQGTVALLQAQPEWVVDVVPDQLWQGERVSSSRVRSLLSSAHFEEVAACLGRPWTMEGRVIYGEQRGRRLGFPTANIPLRTQSVPVSGVYAVRAWSDRLPVCRGVANVGVRPTVGGKRRLLETHLFGFNGEIYGHRLNVEFCHKLREEQRFAGLDELKDQISRDVKAAGDYFARVENQNV